MARPERQRRSAAEISSRLRRRRCGHRLRFAGPRRTAAATGSRGDWARRSSGHADHQRAAASAAGGTARHTAGRDAHSVGHHGQKRVCDRGACGACTVIIEGRTHTRVRCSRLKRRAGKYPDGRRAVSRQHAPSRPTGVLRSRRLDVRLLHARLRHVDGGAARKESESDA